MKKIYNIVELKNLLNENEEICIYGAGEKCLMILNVLTQLKCANIKCIFVSESNENPKRIKGIPVLKYSKGMLDGTELILLALGKKNADVVYKILENSMNKIVVIDYALIIKNINHNIIEDEITGYISKTKMKYMNHIHQRDVNDKQVRRYAWTCWWQGFDKAPDIVKACILSQKRFLPEGVEHIIITRENYSHYIQLPDYIIKKVENKEISITMLSDIIRASLVYKYGGIWIDATVLVYDYFPANYFDKYIYACKSKTSNFASYSRMSLWLWGGKKGNLLAGFVRDAFLEYFQMQHDYNYYLTVDYFLHYAVSNIQIISKAMQELQENNISADVLQSHLDEKYDSKKMYEYCQGSFLQKLTWKLDRYDEELYNLNSIYSYILNEYIGIVG